jgi:uncharacterized protein YjbI with pentapeptide repeats
MNRCNRKVYGRKFSQASLDLDLREAIGGQPPSFKALLLLCTLGLTALGGSVTGALSGYFSRIPFSSLTRLETAWYTVCIIFVVCFWAFEIRRSSLAGALWKAGLIVIITSITAPIIFQSSGAFLANLVITSVFLGSYILAFLTTSLSLSILLALLCHRQYTSVKALGKVLIIFLSLLISYLVGSEPDVKSEFPSPYFGVIKLLAGLLIGFLTVKLSFFVTDVNGQPRKNFEFLRTLAINFSTLGGTSFYNLDLSGIDFTGANLANTDLRAQKFYRTRLKNVKGLDRARVDNRYFNLDNPEVQALLTRGSCQEKNFIGINLQGAYLQDADMRGFNLTDANLTGADLRAADLRGSTLVRTQLAGADLQKADLRECVLIDANLTEADFRKADLRRSTLVRAQVARADFTEADLTGICIEDWSVSSKTRFTNVRCDFIYRRYQDGQPTDRYPAVERNFEANEFASLFQQPENIVELVFKGKFDYSALSLAFYKLQTETPELELELQGIEQREKLWVVKVKSNGNLTEKLIEERLSSVYQVTSDESAVEVIIKDSIYRDYEETKNRLAASEQLVRQLAGITENQAEALKEFSKQAFGNSFFISGSTITNLAGSGQIEYNEAADQVRSLVANSTDSGQVISIWQKFIAQLNEQNVAIQASTQLELIQLMLLAEARRDPEFKQLLIEQEQQIISAMPKGKIATAFQAVIAQLKPSTCSSVPATEDP